MEALVHHHVRIASSRMILIIVIQVASAINAKQVSMMEHTVTEQTARGAVLLIAIWRGVIKRMAVVLIAYSGNTDPHVIAHVITVKRQRGVIEGMVNVRNVLLGNMEGGVI